jgi:epoxyqueuosine reductase
MVSTQELNEIARDLGCAGLGVTTAAEFEGVAATLLQRRDAGMAGKLRFTYKDPARAADVRLSFPWAQSIVVVSWPYMPDAGDPGPGSATTGRVARFAAEDQYRGLRAVLATLEEHLLTEEWRAVSIVDDDRLVDRAAAVRAGLAWWGKSSMVLDPRYGPWLLIGSVVTDALLDRTEPMTRDCGTCTACLPACPTGAIVAPGVLDASLCLAHWTQAPGVIPRSLRTAMSDRIYGCDDCLAACPPGHKVMNAAAVGLGRVDLLRLLAMDDAGLREVHSNFYIPKNQPRFLRRNALVALGNATAEASADGAPVDVVDNLAVLAGYLGNPDGIYRIHAAWAIGRIGGATANQILQQQLAVERSERVVEELETALEELSGGLS